MKKDFLVDRNPYRKSNPLVKLNPLKAQEIREIKNLSTRKIAKIFNVSQSTICLIKNNKYWIN